MEKGNSRRNSNIELLRIILMIMVITLHFNNGEMGGAFNLVQAGTLNFHFLYFLESLSICAVNCFMIISGYFLAYNKKVKLGKIVDLLLIVIFYRIFDYIISLIFGVETFSLKSFAFRFMPTNYFAIFYIVTYLFSPFLVLIFDSINEKKQKYFVMISVLLFVVYSSVLDIGMDFIPGLHSEGLSVISTKGNLSGYSIVQFFVALIVGMYLRRSKFNPKTWILFFVYFIGSLIMTALIHKLPSLYGYCSIFTFINAVCLFLLFNKLNIQNKVINYISKSVFAIFCIHTLPIVNALWKKIITPNHVGGGIGTLLLWLFISVAGMFISCLLLDLIVRHTIGLLKNKVCNKCPVILDMETN